MYRFYSFNNSTTFIKSLTISKLDISNLLSTKKKPCCDSTRALLFSDRQQLAVVRDGNNKARSHAQREQGFFFGLLPKMDHPPAGG
jgi:hypothetical protein